MKTLIFVGLIAVSLALTREEVNSAIDFDESNGVFLLRETTFDDFVNWNDLVLVCFFEDAG